MTEASLAGAPPSDIAGARPGAPSVHMTVAARARLRRRYAAISGLVALLGAILGWLLAGWITGPVRRLTSAAEHVASTGDLEAPVEATGRDETARLGQAFSAMLAALRESRQRQRMLVEDAGHELRTPITSIRTNVEVLHRYPNLESDERGKVVEDLHTEVSQVSTMIDELVLLASGDTEEDDTANSVAIDDLVRAEEAVFLARTRTSQSLGDRGSTVMPGGGT